MSNADKPVFPNMLHESPFLSVPRGGLTKRELFAAMAMQGLLMSIGESINDKQMARYSVNVADALLATLEAEGE